jgi:uncharacterized Zn finger protein (UPF0148 family)
MSSETTSWNRGFYFRIDLPVPPYPGTSSTSSSIASSSQSPTPVLPTPSVSSPIDPSLQWPASFLSSSVYLNSHLTTGPGCSYIPGLPRGNLPRRMSVETSSYTPPSLHTSLAGLVPNMIPTSLSPPLPLIPEPVSPSSSDSSSFQSSTFTSTSASLTASTSPTSTSGSCDNEYAQPKPRDTPEGSPADDKSNANQQHPRRICSHCKTTSTPLWRRSPKQSELLCNACGLYLQARGEYRPQRLIDEDLKNDADLANVTMSEDGKQCSHCFTYRTTVWRRDKEGKTLCNACGVYLKMKGKERPIEFRKDRIRRRQYRRVAGPV